ncbi:MAG: PEP-utilizing enzyme [Neomegalonema sp.]|nr:PEP-utilizing enzyme [Neomegalonema sp.]
MARKKISSLDLSSPEDADAAQADLALRIGVGTYGATDEIGRTGHCLDQLTRAGLDVPPAVVIPAAILDQSQSEPDLLRRAIERAITLLEQASGKRLGAQEQDQRLLLSLRPSPLESVTGMPRALLGVGIGILAPSQSAPDAVIRRGLLRRLAAMHDDLLADTLEETIDTVLDAAESAGEAPSEIALTDALAQVAAQNSEALPANAADEVLFGAQALLAAWHAPRLQKHRAATGTSEQTALVLQELAPPMQEGDGRADLSLHDPQTGEREPGGTLTFGKLGAESPLSGTSSWPIDRANAASPQTARILELANAAQRAMRRPVTARIAVSGGKPVLLGAAPIRATAAASIRMALDAANAGEISRDEALLLVEPKSLEEMLHATVDPGAPRLRIAHGLPASPGAVVGRLAFSAEAAEALSITGEAAILARPETHPGDIQGMHAAAGVFTTRGGMTSHAAVVARTLGRPCIVGASDAQIDLTAQRLIACDGRVFGPGDLITLDGSEGVALAGVVQTRRPELTGAFAILMRWADEIRRLKVRANADTPHDAETARRMGVDGIGLCRTEHMFFEKGRITVMQEMILADSEAERRAALDRLLPMQRTDFERFFEIMSGLSSLREPAADMHSAVPVTIRLLDPPLHEFLPQDEDGIRDLVEATGLTAEKIRHRARELAEYNPMLGKRGCRMGVAYPEIYEMQARAIFEAALAVERRTGRQQSPEIMIPLVSAVRELELLKQRIEAVAQAVAEERGASPHYTIGIMVETPRAALRAEALGAMAAFFSFGTNDLTQMTYGLSRDDAGRLMRDYVERHVFEADPFQSLDIEGVGELMRIGLERGRAANPDLQIGVCGEHGGDLPTIQFCEDYGFDYVSCSPYRAPIARLAAAQAAILHRRAEQEAQREQGA